MWLRIGPRSVVLSKTHFYIMIRRVVRGRHADVRRGRTMMKRVWLALIVLALAACANAPQSQGGVERLYVFNCGDSTVQDISRWTPGANVGKPGAFSANCYLIRHARGLMLWDSGINDSVAAMPGGFQRGAATPRY